MDFAVTANNKTYFSDETAYPKPATVLDCFLNGEFSYICHRGKSIYF